jgi:anti-anti-sigma factor
MLEITDRDDTVTLRVSGRFDFRVIKQFHQVLERTPQTWIVDFTEVNYVDSSALGMLLLLRERVGGVAHRVQLRGLRGQPLDVLLMAKFDRMFKIA